VLGVSFGLAITIGGTIGVGILRTPGEVAAQLPNAWLFIGVWIVGGLYALLGALSVAELGTAWPRSGGFYVFARRALGEYAGFVIGWSDWLGSCGTIAAVAIVIGEYMSAPFLSLANRRLIISLAVVIGFALLQWRGVRWGGRAQELTTLLKSLAFVALVICCFVFGSQNSAAANAVTLPTGLSLLTAIVLALQGVIVTYDGWYGMIYFGEEVRAPERDVPRAMFGGVLAVTVIYLLLNAALLYVLPMSSIANQKLAVGAAAEAVFGASGGLFIGGLAVITLLSLVNATTLSATRVLYTMSRDGLFTGRAVRVNRGGTPTVALFTSAGVAVLFILTGTFEGVLAVLAFFFVVSYSSAFLSVFVLRRREPETPRPYRTWGYPWTTAIALIGSLMFLIGAVASDTRTSIYALLLLGGSYPVFLVLKRLAR